MEESRLDQILEQRKQYQQEIDERRKHEQRETEARAAEHTELHKAAVEAMTVAARIAEIAKTRGIPTRTITTTVTRKNFIGHTKQREEVIGHGWLLADYSPPSGGAVDGPMTPGSSGKFITEDGELLQFSHGYVPRDEVVRDLRERWISHANIGGVSDNWSTLDSVFHSLASFMDKHGIAPEEVKD